MIESSEFEERKLGKAGVLAGGDPYERSGRLKIKRNG